MRCAKQDNTAYDIEKVFMLQMCALSEYDCLFNDQTPKRVTDEDDWTVPSILHGHLLKVNIAIHSRRSNLLIVCPRQRPSEGWLQCFVVVSYKSSVQAIGNCS